MTRWLTSALTLTLLIAFTGLAVAQPKAGGRKAIDTTSPQPRDLRPVTTTGVVTHVDHAAKTFTVNANGKAVTFGAANLATLPEVGATAEVTHQPSPGGMAQATTVKSSKSNTSERAGSAVPPSMGGGTLAPTTGMTYGQRAGSPSVVAGKVTHVDPVAKTFTVDANGKPVTFGAASIDQLPKLGTMVDVAYTWAGPPATPDATSVKSSKSNSSD
ncbi:MAG TPA: hypothetical protein VK548_14340 [Candidatus Acidoferrum sp.]|nr:hypothetical protein [Candidatus Acidoferrum sp.]